MSVVSSELRVGTLERGVTGSLGLLDSARKLAIAHHFDFGINTRSGAPCATGCAGSCSLTLQQCQYVMDVSLGILLGSHVLAIAAD